jgi:hypothetical protein
MYCATSETYHQVREAENAAAKDRRDKFKELFSRAHKQEL